MEIVLYTLNNILIYKLIFKMITLSTLQVATRIMKFLIENFGVSNLFGRDNYEFYARITGRILKVEEDWIFSFRYPPENLVSRKHIILCPGSLNQLVNSLPYNVFCCLQVNCLWKLKSHGLSMNVRDGDSNLTWKVSKTY
jgi:hypothetical protein